MSKVKKKPIEKVKNVGHRCGADVDFVTAPENSLQAIDEIKDYQDRKNFKYWEWDVTESCSPSLFANHDAVKSKPIKRLYNLVNDPPTNVTYKSLFYELSTFEINNFLRLKNDMSVPSAEKIMEKLVQVAVKPIAIEIKKLDRIESKWQLFDLVKESMEKNNKLEIFFMMKKKKFYKMDDHDWFAEQCERDGIKLKLYGCTKWL